METQILITITPDELQKMINQSIKSALIELDLKPSDEKEVLSLKETAEFLGLKVPTIYSKVSKRDIPVNKQFGKLYFLRSELMAYIKNGKRSTNYEIDEEAVNILRKRKGRYPALG